MQRLSNLARGASTVIRDHVGRHGRTMLAVTAIDFLNHAFPPIATGKIGIDIGPAFAPFAEESLENQVIAYRINRCDTEAITNRAVGRAAAALHHNVMLATKIDDVPNDQKISWESELLNT